MDRKVLALETELKAIDGETKMSLKLLAVVNDMASKMVDAYKCISKSKANEKLETYMQLTKNLAEIKAHIVAENVKLESYLISLGYIEEEESDSNSDIEDNSTDLQPPVAAPLDVNTAVTSHRDFNLTVSTPVTSDLIPSTANAQNISNEQSFNAQTVSHIERILTYIESVSSVNLPTDVRTTDSTSSFKPVQTTDCQSEILKTIDNDTISQTEQDRSTLSIGVENSNIYRDNELDAEEILKRKHIISFEDKHMKTLLETSYEPNLRLQRSSSSSSILSSSTNSSSIIDAISKPKLKEIITPIINRTTTEQQNSTHPLFIINKAAIDRTISTNVNPHSSEETINRKFLEPRFPKVEELCLISSCKNPQNLYIQLYEQCDSLLALYDHLNAAYEHCTLQYTIKSIAKEKIGDCCTAYLEDFNGWHRVRVLDWQLMSHINTVLVFVVDYGDTLKVPVENLRKLMSEFFDFPVFAIKCTLENLYPPSSTDNSINTIWTTTELNAFYEFMQKGNQITYKLTYVNTESNPIGIDLTDIEDLDPENSLGQELINANIVRQIISLVEVKLIPDNSIMLEQIKTVQGLHGTNKNMSEAERLAKYLQNDLYNEPKNIVEAITGYDANDERRVCKFTRPDGTCFKGLNCKLEHVQLRPDGFTTDKNYVYHTALHNAVLPCAEEEIKIYITCITQPTEFYGHIMDRDELKIYGTSLQQLTRDFKNPKVVKKFQRLSLQPSIGQIIVTKNWDNSWCRAKVINIDGLTVDVFIVDYGETITVNIDSLREISRDYLILPFQAVKFCLWDIEKIPDLPDEQLVTYMETHFLCYEFIAKVRTCCPYLHVEVYIRKDVDMGEDLISHGFARRTFGKQLIIETTLVD